MSRTKIKGVSSKKLRAQQIKCPRTISWISMFWGILYSVIAISIAFSYYSDILTQLLLCLGIGLAVLPYFLFPVYLSSYYPKERASFMLAGIFGLLGIRFVIYALFYESHTGGADIISWKTALWGVALFALVVFLLVISRVLKGVLRSKVINVGILLSLLPALAVSAIFSCFAVKDDVAFIILILFLLCGEVLLHLAMLMFCRKGNVSATELKKL